ncbi:MAG: lysophospholipid acyltransferase family protein [Bdellovibrionota bacterium]
MPMKSLKEFFNVLNRNQPPGTDPTQKVFGLTDTDPEILMYRVLPHFLMEVARKYFRLEVEGLENIPRRGAAILTPNHSGYSGFDAFLLAHEVFKSTGRVPRILAHHLWFLTKATSIPAEKVGFIEANMANALMQLKKNNLVVIFPEGEYGNFKPTMKRYHLQEFKLGFIRMALQRQCPIVPTLILGAEETHINLAQLKFTKYLRGLVLPLPLNVIPLPAKWKFVFLPPIHLPYKPEAADDRELVEDLAQDIRERMQKALSEHVGKRGSIWFDAAD